MPAKVLELVGSSRARRIGRGSCAEEMLCLHSCTCCAKGGGKQ